MLIRYISYCFLHFSRHILYDTLLFEQTNPDAAKMGVINILYGKKLKFSGLKIKIQLRIFNYPYPEIIN